MPLNFSLMRSHSAEMGQDLQEIALTDVRLGCVSSLVEKKDGDVVEHPGLVELGVEDNLIIDWKFGFVSRV